MEAPDSVGTDNHYLMGLVMGLTNPLGILWWVTAGAAFVAMFNVLGVAGFMLGLLAWMSCFSVFVHYAGKKVKIVYPAIIIGSGLMMLFFGLMLLYDVDQACAGHLTLSFPGRRQRYAPFGDRLEHGKESLPVPGQRIFYPGRYFGIDCPVDDVEIFQVPQVLCDRLRVHVAHLSLEFGEPQRSLAEVPDDEQVPPAAEDLEQIAHVTFTVIFTFHGDLSITYFLVTMLLYYS